MAVHDGNTTGNWDRSYSRHASVKLLPYPLWSDQAPGGISILDLPIAELRDGNNYIKHLVDLTCDESH